MILAETNERNHTVETLPKSRGDRIGVGGRQGHHGKETHNPKIQIT